MIAVADYGVGNLASVKKAFAAVGAEAELVADPDALARADAIVLPGVGNIVVGTVEYGGERVAIAGNENVLGVQFHPEKSGANGLRLLRAFADSVDGGSSGGGAPRTW